MSETVKCPTCGTTCRVGWSGQGQVAYDCYEPVESEEIAQLRQQLADLDERRQAWRVQAEKVEQECEAIRRQASELQQALATERAGAREMRRVLASIQYCQQVSGTVSLCPICDQPDTRDHAPDCTILAALATDAGQTKGEKG